ncbi:MAG: trigger factor [Rhodospirillales bacterium]|nr:trigger factor [Rhodospirillales bacterium]
MQVTEIKSEGLSREYKVALPAKEIEEKVAHRLSEIAKTASMPGFRPGKVPASLLRKRYGPSIMGEVLESAVSSSAEQAIAEKGVRPVSRPEFEVTSFEDGKDLEYTMSFDILPEISIPDFSKVKIERMVPKVEEKDVEETLKRIADANKTSEPITTKRKTKSGDMVIIDFVGKIDGEAFAGGAAEGYSLELGSGNFIPGFEDQLIGVNAGDAVEVKVAFPAEYGAEALAGKDAVFDVKVNEIHETKPSPIDDDLAKLAGAESLDKLREMVREEQGREFKEYGRMLVKRRLMDQLADLVEFDVPPRLSDQEYNSIIHQWQHEQHGSDAAHADQHDHEEAHAIEPDSEQVAEFRMIANRRVRLGLLLNEIGRANNIQIGQDDLNKAMISEARKYPGQEQQVMEYFKKNPQALEQAAAPIYEDKIIDFVLEMVKVTDKTATMEDLIKEIEAENEAQESKSDKAKPKKKAAAKDSDGDSDKKKAAPKKKAAAKKDKE